jgi:hypothetical protein
VPWYPGAIKRDIGRGSIRHTPVRFVLHTAVVNASELKPGATGNYWHFYVGPTGTVYQYVDTAMRAGAETYPGSVGSISVESWDGYREDANRRPIPLDAYGVTGWRSTSDVPAWTAAQVASLAKLWAWLRKTHPTIPNRLATTSKDDGTSHGLAYHRLGVKLRATDKLSQTGGVVWSSSAGKVCPGDRRIAQLPGILASATDAVGLSATIDLDAYPGHILSKDGNDRGEAVARLQEALGLKPDGIFGPATDVAVRAAQARLGVAVDGKVGPATWAALITKTTTKETLVTTEQADRIIALLERIAADQLRAADAVTVGQEGVKFDGDLIAALKSIPSATIAPGTPVVPETLTWKLES